VMVRSAATLASRSSLPVVVMTALYLTAMTTVKTLNDARRLSRLFVRTT
jgi:hypothetical protein